MPKGYYMLVAQTNLKAAKYEVPTWMVMKSEALSDVTACRLVECAATKKKGERYSETSLTMYQSALRNISEDLSKSIALIIQGCYFI